MKDSQARLLVFHISKIVAQCYISMARIMHAYSHLSSKWTITLMHFQIKIGCYFCGCEH